ncbi:hypothetical protein PT974_04185 [Cladobotryum mycophilum]|uniref:Uncharacterized protein n=1 Tax=Cladobotryum mycophilum TaxID=491253 RepID=A0ABR0SUF7_9HYPO
MKFTQLLGGLILFTSVVAAISPRLSNSRIWSSVVPTLSLEFVSANFAESHEYSVANKLKAPPSPKDRIVIDSEDD